MSLTMEVNGQKVTLDDETVKKFEALPPKKLKINWTPEMDALLLKYWKIKNGRDVGRLLGYSETSCRRRYDELTKE